MVGRGCTDDSGDRPDVWAALERGGGVAALLGIPLAFLFPVSVHFKLLKGSTFVYTLNGCVMVVAIGLCLFCTIVTCATWNQTGNDNR